MLKKVFFALFSLLVFHVTTIYSKSTIIDSYAYQDTFKLRSLADATIYPGTVNADLNIFQMIQGRVAGVWISGGPSFYRIRVRGAHRPPLVVIDGMQFNNYGDSEINSILQSIAPIDVDRIEVIKGIGGSVLYRNSGNGVLVIHTKPASVE